MNPICSTADIVVAVSADNVSVLPRLELEILYKVDRLVDRILAELK
jgi:hypothetical protein